MLKILVPVDGSSKTLHTLRHVIAERDRHHALELHLLNVQPSLPRHVARFVGGLQRESWHRERANQALAGATRLLATSSVPYQTHWAVGDRATEICRAAKDLGVHRIVLGAARKSPIARMLEESVTDKVLEATPVPVEVIVGNAGSPWERWGLTAAAVGASGLLLLALD